MNLYTPNNEFETRVSVPFIRKVQDRLKERDLKSDGIDSQFKGTLLMDTRFTFPVRYRLTIELEWSFFDNDGETDIRMDGNT